MKQTISFKKQPELCKGMQMYKQKSVIQHQVEACNDKGSSAEWLRSEALKNSQVPVISCVTLGKLLTFSVLHCFICKMEIIIDPTSQVWLRMKLVDTYEQAEQSLEHNESSGSVSGFMFISSPQPQPPHLWHENYDHSPPSKDDHDQVGIRKGSKHHQDCSKAECYLNNKVPHQGSSPQKNKVWVCELHHKGHLP